MCLSNNYIFFVNTTLIDFFEELSYKYIMTEKIVIIGGGQASLSCASQLRSIGFDGDICMICDESSYELNLTNGSIPDTSTIIPSGTIYSWTFTPNPLITGATNVGVSENINVFDSGILDNIDPLYYCILICIL